MRARIAPRPVETATLHDPGGRARKERITWLLKGRVNPTHARKTLRGFTDLYVLKSQLKFLLQ